jgi:hypothetical protein
MLVHMLSWAIERSQMAKFQCEAAKYRAELYHRQAMARLVKRAWVDSFSTAMCVKSSFATARRPLYLGTLRALRGYVWSNPGTIIELSRHAT